MTDSYANSSRALIRDAIVNEEYIPPQVKSKTIHSNAQENRRHPAPPTKSCKGKKVTLAAPLDPAKLERLFSVAERVGLFATGQHHKPLGTTSNSGLEHLPFDELYISTDCIEQQRNLKAEEDTPSDALPASNYNSCSKHWTQHDSEIDPAIMSTQDRAIHEQLTHAQRCQKDSEDLLVLSPQHVRYVSQSFLKQADAFTLADQCNQGMPMLPPAQVILSAVPFVPAPPKHAMTPQSITIGMKKLQQHPAVLPNSGVGLRGAPPVDASHQGKPLSATKEDYQVQQHASGVQAAAPRFSFGPEHYNAPSSAQAQSNDNSISTSRENQEQPHPVASEKQDNRGEKTAVPSDLDYFHAKYIEALESVNAPPPASELLAHADGQQQALAASSIIPTLSKLDYTRREEAIRVFCVEKCNERTGAYFRTFTAASISWVWKTYGESPPLQLHWYEIIREGRPCHLYFDLEYPRGPTLNAQVDGDALVDLLLELVDTMLRKSFNVGVDLGNVYELDSSTSAKFSRHLIVRLPGHAFMHNLAVGDFVHQVVAAGGENLYVDKALAICQPGDVDHVAPRTCFVDTAVYTRNRHFRLAYSCKGGKTAILRPTNRFACAGNPSRPSPARVFLDTLICHVPVGAVLLAVRPPGDQATTGAFQSTATAVAGPITTRSVAWKMDWSDGKSKTEDDSKTETLRELAQRAVPFIEKAAAQRAGQEAKARTVAFCGLDGTVAYSMIGPGSHFCENIGRPHKGNHVYFVADFSSGKYAQKCHDPECSHFRSAWMPLPPQLCIQQNSPVVQAVQDVEER